jgi:Fe-S cluster biogenesis protein NfuA
MSAITVRAESTPNPQTMRFSSSVPLTETPADFKSAKETLTAPLARKIFGFPWTAGVYIGRDFVTVTKQDWVDWETLAEPLSGLIAEHLERGEPVMTNQTAAASAKRAPAATATQGHADETAEETIKRILEDEIRPAVAMDGGDITFSRYEDGIVYLLMQGSCAGCPSSTMTLKMGIETRLKEVLPEIREVVSAV